jgi:hypothetical protein
LPDGSLGVTVVQATGTTVMRSVDGHLTPATSCKLDCCTTVLWPGCWVDKQYTHCKAAGRLGKVTQLVLLALSPLPAAIGAMLSQRHAAERLGTCWHGGGLSLDDVRKQMRDALDEFLVAGSGSEVAAVSGLPHVVVLNSLRPCGRPLSAGVPVGV